MTWSRIVKGTGVFLLLVVLHYSVRPLFASRVTMDFLVVAVLLLAVRVRPGVAALLGFATGLVADSLTPLSLGAGALALSVVGFSASRLKAVFFADNVLLHAIFFFAGKWAYDVLYLLAERRTDPGHAMAQIFLWSPLSALATATAGVVIILLFRITLEPQTA
jgi:rod shape-determining protein MreD